MLPPRVVRPRVLVLRVVVLRVPVERDDVPVFAAPLPAVDALARVPVDLDAVERPPDLAAVERVPLALRAPVLRVEVVREELLRPPPPELLDDELDPLSLSSDHFPDMTRCAASATASAISEPSLLALDIAVLAALVAASAASMPASRIARRAFGLALIAAAAAASPAASISRLIAALVILSTVLSPPELDRELDDDFEERPVFDFAMATSLCRRKDTSEA